MLVTRHPSPHYPARQRGAVLLLFVTALAVTGIGLMLRQLATPRQSAPASAEQIWQQAIDGLAGYALKEKHIGVLPCPDADGDGAADLLSGSGAGATCRNGNQGYFPAATLGIAAADFALLKPDGNTAPVATPCVPGQGSELRLCYAVNPALRNSGSSDQVINSNTLEASATAFRLFSSDGRYSRDVSFSEWMALAEKRIVHNVHACLTEFHSKTGTYPAPAPFARTPSVLGVGGTRFGTVPLRNTPPTGSINTLMNALEAARETLQEAKTALASASGDSAIQSAAAALAVAASTLADQEFALYVFLRDQIVTPAYNTEQAFLTASTRAATTSGSGTRSSRNSTVTATNTALSSLAGLITAVQTTGYDGLRFPLANVQTIVEADASRYARLVAGSGLADSNSNQNRANILTTPTQVAGYDSTLQNLGAQADTLFARINSYAASQPASDSDNQTLSSNLLTQLAAFKTAALALGSSNGTLLATRSDEALQAVQLAHDTALGNSTYSSNYQEAIRRSQALKVAIAAFWLQDSLSTLRAWAVLVATANSSVNSAISSLSGTLGTASSAAATLLATSLNNSTTLTSAQGNLTTQLATLQGTTLPVFWQTLSQPYVNLAELTLQQMQLLVLSANTTLSSASTTTARKNAAAALKIQTDNAAAVSKALYTYANALRTAAYSSGTEGAAYLALLVRTTANNLASGSASASVDNALSQTDTALNAAASVQAGMTYPVGWSGACRFLSDSQSWFYNNQWHGLIFYQADSSGNNLSVGSNPAGRSLVVLSAGPHLSGQTRPSTNLADYLEGSNADSSRHPPANSAAVSAVFVHNPRSATFNDQLFY